METEWNVKLGVKLGVGGDNGLRGCEAFQII